MLPRLVELLQKGHMWMIGDGEKLLDNTYVGSLVDAVMLAIENTGNRRTGLQYSRRAAGNT